MLLEFPVLTDEEIEKIGLLEPGVYKFKVVSAQGGYSQTSGNPQITVGLKVHDKNGLEYVLLDFLVNTPRMLYKIKHFCEATGIGYTGKLAEAACLNREGQVEIVIIPQKPDGKGGFYRAKNAVKDYVKPSEGFALELPKAVNATQDTGFHNDDIPF